VESKEGKSGGVRLSRAPEAITLADVYLAVHEEGRHLLPMYKNEPNRKCTVGANIQRVLDDLYADIDEHVLDKLSAISLENLYRQFC
jgi:DNA-binding IscR family transcriptional regulator